MSLDEIITLITSAGKTAAERDSFYNILRVFDRAGARAGGQGVAA
jgi:2-iminoacetate synthase ThiH